MSFIFQNMEFDTKNQSAPSCMLFRKSVFRQTKDEGLMSCSIQELELESVLDRKPRRSQGRDSANHSGL